MDFETFVKPKIKFPAPSSPEFNEFSSTEKDRIIDAIKIAYASPTARAMIDNWINMEAEILIRRDKTNGATPGAGEVWLNLDTLNSLYIDNNGTAVRHTDVTAIVHELVHALVIDPLRHDDGAGTEYSRGAEKDNYRGETVDYANIIYKELDEIYADLAFPQQNSYIGQGDDSVLELGFKYTNGVEIDRSVVVSAVYNPNPGMNGRVPGFS
jgi:hypothetical protein